MEVRGSIDASQTKTPSILTQRLVNGLECTPWAVSFNWPRYLGSIECPQMISSWRPRVDVWGCANPHNHPNSGRDIFVLASTMRRLGRKSSSSAKPTNNTPRTPTPPITEHTGQESATARDRRAPEASSGATSLSIASPSCDLGDTTPNEGGSSKESRWRTAYAAARMAVDIANASSDLFLPLKAVVGALSVLIKNYDASPLQTSFLLTIDRFLQQTATNADRIRDTEERVRSLDEVLTSPVDDQDREEMGRRGALRKFARLCLRSAGTYLNQICYLQEVGWYHCQAQTVVRAPWAREVLEERRSCRRLEWLHPRPS